MPHPGSALRWRLRPRQALTFRPALWQSAGAALNKA